MHLTNRVGLVTGGGTGLGREISLQLAAEGMSVAIGYSKSRADAEATVDEIRSKGGKAITIQADLLLSEQYGAIFEQIDFAYGRLDLLVHNAATTRFVPFSDLDSITESAWDEIFALNTRAAFFLARESARLCCGEVGAARSSPRAPSPDIAPTTGSSIPYAVSKAALIHVTKCLAVALAPDIRVNCVAPGLLITRWVEGFTEDRIKQIVESAPLKKTADLSDVAAAFVMLARNTSITGETIVVDAGQLL